MLQRQLPPFDRERGDTGEAVVPLGSNGAALLPDEPRKTRMEFMIRPKLYWWPGESRGAHGGRRKIPVAPAIHTGDRAVDELAGRSIRDGAGVGEPRQR